MLKSTVARLPVERENSLRIASKSCEDNHLQLTILSPLLSNLWSSGSTACRILFACPQIIAMYCSARFDLSVFRICTLSPSEFRYWVSGSVRELKRILKSNQLRSTTGAAGGGGILTAVVFRFTGILRNISKYTRYATQMNRGRG